MDFFDFVKLKVLSWSIPFFTGIPHKLTVSSTAETGQMFFKCSGK